MKKILATLLALTLALSLSVPAFASSPVGDVREALNIPADEPVQWFIDTDSYLVNLALNMGVVQGCGNGRFRPDDIINRAEYATILYRLFASQYDQAKTADVFEDGWWGAPAGWLHSVVIAENRGKVTEETMRELLTAFYDGPVGSFGPGEAASSDFIIEMIYVLYGTAENEIDLSDEATSVLKDSVAWLYTRQGSINEELFRKVTSGSLLTREEAVEFIFQACELS